MFDSWINGTSHQWSHGPIDAPEEDTSMEPGLNSVLVVVFADLPDFLTEPLPPCSRVQEVPTRNPDKKHDHLRCRDGAFKLIENLAFSNPRRIRNLNRNMKNTYIGNSRATVLKC